MIVPNSKRVSDAFREMLESVAEKHSFEECKEVLKKSEPLRSHRLM